MVVRALLVIRSVWTLGSLGTKTSILEQRTELDSHADRSVVGRDTALLIHDYETPVWVQGYNEDVGERSNCCIVSAVVAYDHPVSGDVYMLMIHQAILIPSMPHNLLCPMQLRDHGLTVNDERNYMVLNPMEEHHAITFRDRNSQGRGPLQIPLELHGVTSYFPSRKPTKEEYENTPEDLCVELTAEAPDWDPASKAFQQQEEAMLQADRRLKDSVESWSLKRMISVLNTTPQSETPEFHLCDAIHSHVLASTDAHAPQIVASVTSGIRKPCIQAAKLAKNWGIGLETATRTGHHTKGFADCTAQHTITEISHQRSTTSIPRIHARGLHRHTGVPSAVMVPAEPIRTSLRHKVRLVQGLPNET